MNLLPAHPPFEKIPADAPATSMITNEVIGIILGTYTSNPPIDQLKDAQFGRRLALTADGVNRRCTRLGR